jgi:hypothetical protein
MSEFSEMIREAFVGEEPYDPSPGRAALEASIRKYERRHRTVRLLSWFMVTAMSVLFFFAGWKFLSAGEDASTKELVLWATLFLWGNAGVAFGKMYLFTTLSDIGLMKELKRTQLMLVDDEA